MDTTSFEQLRAVIRSRRTTKAVAMNAREIPDAQIGQLLELADWAPTHGQTEPWRFFIYAGQHLKRFGQIHAGLYWDHTEASRRTQPKYDKLVLSANRASHLLVAVMKRGANPKITAQEEISAASAAVQNILLGATALGIASFWSTGGMTHHPAMKEFLNLDEEDRILGLIYLGYSDEPDKKGERKILLSEKARWETIAE